MSLLDLKNIRLTIENNLILNNISLSMKEGEIVGLVGESGSGKSLTSLSIMQLLPQNAKISGSILFEHNDLLKLSEKELCEIRGSHIGMVFQEPMSALNPLMTIGKQITEILANAYSLSRKERERRARVLLDRVGLSPGKDFYNRYPHELSGGQKQRVVIAFAIALKPKLIIADEPTTSLDVTTQAQILQLLKRLVLYEKSSLLLISHDLAIISEFVDRIAILRKGRIIEENETNKLFSSPQQEYTKDLIRAYIFRKRKDQTKKADSADKEILLTAKAISKNYKKSVLPFWGKKEIFTAVDQVNFHIRQGETIGLVGQSGCGKSTLSRILLGLDKPSEGSVLFKGRDISKFSKKEWLDFRKQVQIVFQDPGSSFNPRLKVGFSVAEPMRLLKNSISSTDLKARILQSLIEVGLHYEDAEKYPHEFSGGQRQRLSIARALIVRPSLLILDESVSALDGTTRAQIIELLSDLKQRRNITYLFISHDLNMVRSITERILIMRQGQIIEDGATESVLSVPQKSYTASLINASPNLENFYLKNSLFIP